MTTRLSLTHNHIPLPFSSNHFLCCLVLMGSMLAALISPSKNRKLFGPCSRYSTSLSEYCHTLALNQRHSTCKGSVPPLGY